MNTTTIMLEFDKVEFTALLASLSITVVPGFPDGITEKYLDADSETLEAGLQKLIDRELVFRTETGISIAKDLLEALVRLTRPTLVMWAITTVEGPKQRLADIIADEYGFTALLPRVDDSVTVLLPEDRAAAADVLVGLAGVSPQTDQASPSAPTGEVTLARAIELIHHALGKPDPVAQAVTPTEELLSSATAITTFSFWNVAPSGESSPPREFAVAIVGGKAWLLALADPATGQMQMGPISESDLTTLVAGTDG